WFNQLEDGEEVTAIELGTTGDLELYARWVAREYTITFDIDGTTSAITVSYLTILTVIDIPAIPTKAHYDQVAPEWDSDPVGHEVTGNYTFTAVYYINEYTISFDTNNGLPMDPIKVAYNTTPASVDNPIRPGYSFNAWYIDSELIDLFDINVPITGDMTLYATYEIQYYNVEIDSVFEKQDIENYAVQETFSSAASTQQFTIFNVLYGEMISPVRNYEGYIFHHFSYDGDDYISLDDLVEVLGNITGLDAIQVHYRRVIITLTFNQDPDLFDEGESPNEVFYLYYDEPFDLNHAPDLKGKDNYSVNWNRLQFINLRQNVDVYALYYAEGVKTIEFRDGGTIRYLITQQKDIDDEWIDEALDITAPIWTLSKTGYEFLGWYTEENGGDYVAPGLLLFSNLTEMKTVYYARWEQLNPFSKPTNINVLVELEEEEIVISWTLVPPTINDEKPKEFRFIVNNVEIIVPIANVLLAGTTYTLNVNNYPALFNEFKVLLEVGKHELTIQAIGDGSNHYHGPISDVKLHTNESIYDQDPTGVAVYDYFIVEQFGDVSRYVFYSNLTYVFGSSYSFEIITGHEFAEVNGNRIITKNNYGAFRFRMIRTGHPTVVYDALVIPDVRGFSIGSNYQTYKNAQLESSTRFLDSGDPYYVGYQNNYYLDIRILNNQGSRIPLAQVELEYTLFQVIGGTSQLIPEGDWKDHIEFFDGNQFRMKESALGNTYEIKVTPHYQAIQMQVDELTYTFTVNDGHNAFSNQQLRSLYANMDVSRINIHANLVAELAANQMNADGSPKNIRPSVGNLNNGDVYTRFARNVDDDEITIEGNYLTIDGSNLPYSNKNSGSGLVGLAEAFEIVNVRIAIFGYDVKDSDEVNNSEFNIKNLQILGNTTIPSVNFGGTAEEILQQEQLMSRNSGGYIGIMVSNGTANYTNLDIRFTVIGIMHDSFGYKDSAETIPMELGQINFVKINDNWANSIYTRGSVGIEIQNSYIGQSGGPAIHVIDTRQGGNEKNPTIVIHNSTEVKNYVSGEEAWFKAYAMSSIALQLKSGVQQGIAPTQRNIIDLITNPVTGLQSEMINVILLTETSEDAKTVDPNNNDFQNGGSEIRFVLEDDTGQYTLERPWNYLGLGDPRIDDGQFGFPVGKYSNLADFGTLIDSIVATANYLLSINEINSDQHAALIEGVANLASLAAFYNLDALEVITAYGAATTDSDFGGSFIAAINYLYSNHTFPRYMEVLAPVPLFSGFSTVLIELVDVN
ncbi:MAG: InlB B-repeat-containing protein, partial [Acholeplasmataceae bacterium]